MVVGAASIRERNKRLKRVQKGLEEPRKYDTNPEEAWEEAGLDDDL